LEDQSNIQYRQDLIQKIRSGKAQIRLDKNDNYDNKQKYAGLLSTIFPGRQFYQIGLNYFWVGIDGMSFCSSIKNEIPTLPIIDAFEFISHEF